MKKAFSLIELILSLAIIAFLVLILSNLFNFNSKFLRKSYKEEREYKDLYTAMLFVDSTLRDSPVIYEEYFDGGYKYMASSNRKEDKKYYFAVKNKALYIYRQNEEGGSGPNKISDLASIDFLYEDGLLSYKLVSLNSSFTFESSIYFGGAR